MGRPGKYLEVGTKFGKWTVIEYGGLDKKSNKMYKCKCECSIENIIRGTSLTTSDTKSCKSCSHADPDLTGKTINGTFVIKKIINPKKEGRFYLVKCECGTERMAPGYLLKSGGRVKCIKCRNKSHGMSLTSTYKIWRGLFRRCYNKKFKAYKYYGARGIKVCERWFDFNNFLSDMGKHPKGLSLDRRNNDGDYEPTNCRWATALMQVNNRRKG